jgi:hypothetical protein
VYASNITVTNAKKAINAQGLKESSLENFNFSDINISTATSGEINFAKNWTLEKINVKPMDGKEVSILNSTGIKKDKQL